MYDLAYFKAKEMLQRNRQVLEKIVEELLEFEILSQKVKSHYFELFILIMLILTDPLIWL